MARHHLIDGIKVPFTAEEETAWDAKEKAWANSALDRDLTNGLDTVEKVNAVTFPTKP